MQALACLAGSLYIRLVRYTGRWRISGEDIPDSFRRDAKPFILSFWHGRLLMMPYCWRDSRLVSMLISDHRDGRLISGTIRYFAIDSVVGSSRRGGAQATRQLVRLLRGGGIVGITPDGPTGPCMRVGGGTVALAQMSGVPVIPVTFAASRRRVLASWDRFVLALPFSRGVFLWGDPIEVPKGADRQMLEDKRLELEQAMNALCARADEMVGQQPIDPDPPAAAGDPAPAGGRR